MEEETSIKETSTVPQNDFVFEETQITEMPKDENDTVPIESILDDVSTEMPTIDIPSTNITLIKDAYESGAIDEPTYSMYAYLAGHDPGELPLEYAMADAETLYDSTYELLYLAENWESLSTDMKSVLEPYLLPISDERSIYNPNKTEDDSSNNLVTITSHAAPRYTHQSKLFYIDDVPPKVTISEAIEIAKQYSTSDSSAFVNGILDAIYKEQKQIDDS